MPPALGNEQRVSRSDDAFDRARLAEQREPLEIRLFDVDRAEVPLLQAVRIVELARLVWREQRHLLASLHLNQEVVGKIEVARRHSAGGTEPEQLGDDELL